MSSRAHSQSKAALRPGHSRQAAESLTQEECEPPNPGQASCRVHKAKRVEAAMKVKAVPWPPAQGAQHSGL